MRDKFFVGVIITFLLLLFLAMLLAPFVFEGQLDARIRNEIKNHINAQVSYHNFSLSFIRCFPNLDISADDILIIGVQEFNGDTLIAIKRVSVAISIKNLLGSDVIKLPDVNIAEPHISVIVNSNGMANWTIIKSSAGGGGTAQPSLFSLHVGHYKVQNGEVNYVDSRNGSSIQIHHLSLEGKGSVINDLYEVSLSTTPYTFIYRSDSTTQQAISGSLNFSLDFKASKNDIEQKKYEAFLFAGSATVLNLQYTNSKISKPISIAGSKIAFTQSDITADSLRADIGKSDISLTGTITNYINYLLDKGDLKGSLIAHSEVFEVNEWLKKDTVQAKAQTVPPGKSAPPTKPQYLKIPAHIDLTVKAQFDKIGSDKLLIESLRGNLLIKDETVSLTNISANLLGGSATLSAKYDTKNTGAPAINFAYVITKMDIQQAFNSVKAIGEVGPGIKYVSGICSGSINGSGKLKPDMSVDYNSLTGNGKILMPHTKISELPVLDEIYKVTKIPSLRNLEVKNAETYFVFKNGRVFMQPTDLHFTNGYSMYLQGSSGFDQTVDYDMKLRVPAKEAVSSSPIAQGILSFLPGLASKLPETMDFTFKINGKADKPQVKLLNMAPVNAQK